MFLLEVITVLLVFLAQLLPSCAVLAPGAFVKEAVAGASLWRSPVCFLNLWNPLGMCHGSQPQAPVLPGSLGLSLILVLLRETEGVTLA